ANRKPTGFLAAAVAPSTYHYFLPHIPPRPRCKRARPASPASTEISLTGPTIGRRHVTTTRFCSGGFPLRGGLLDWVAGRVWMGLGRGGWEGERAWGDGWGRWRGWRTEGRV